MKTEIRPSNIEHITFGVEIETSIPRSVNIPIGSYHNGTTLLIAPHFQNKYWKAESDGSIRPQRGQTACEFVSPVLKGEAGVKHLIEFVAWLNTIGAKVNDSCGLHIHIGVEGWEGDESKFVKILARLATRNATALYAQTGTLSREQGHYCKRAASGERKQITIACRTKNLQALRGDRYQLLNLTNVTTRRTVEFRCFAGTLNVQKILCHLLSVMLLCKVAAGRKSLTNWDPSEQLSGADALSNLFKSRATFSIVSALPFHEHRRELLAKGFEMAQKYDVAKATETQRGAILLQTERRAA